MRKNTGRRLPALGMTAAVLLSIVALSASPAMADTAPPSEAPTAAATPSGTPTPAAPSASTPSATPRAATPTPAATPAPAPAPTTSTPSATTPTPAGQLVDITLALTPSDRAGLHSTTLLASTLPQADRIADLASGVPAAASHDQVATALKAAGMTVTGQTPYATTARATAAQADAFFSVTLTGSGASTHPDKAATIPSGLTGVVTAVLGLDQRPVFRPRDLPYGFYPDDLRSAYGVGLSGATGAGATIASLQFSGWDPTDLTTYAQAVDQPVPSVTEISVDGASSRAFDGSGGQQEVAEDQEMIAAGAPLAKQQIYFAPNSEVGIFDAFQRIATDSTNGTLAALSTSWGICETRISPAFEQAIEDAVDRTVLGGTTTFAASGDYGAYDCSTPDGADSTLDVDFPAVLPTIVAVGGTTLTQSGGRWQESAWFDNGPSEYGGGGGESTRTLKGPYQDVAGDQYRKVPDISADADMQRPIIVYVGSSGGFRGANGTSADAPLMAAQYVATLAQSGCTRGDGDIHPYLYSQISYDSTPYFYDVTTGTNGYYSATRNYDEATGLGTPNWGNLADIIHTGPDSSCNPQAPDTGTILVPGDSETSPDGQYTLLMQGDGNLVEYGNGRALWNSGTSGHPGAEFISQSDGNGVIYSADGQPLWNTQTVGHGTANVLSVANTGVVSLGSGWSASPVVNTLGAGLRLSPGWTLRDATNRLTLLMQGDGNLVLYQGTTALWNTGTSGAAGAFATLQTDGNFVVYSAASRALWNSRSGGTGSGTQLALQSDGNLVLYKGASAVWFTGTRLR